MLITGIIIAGIVAHALQGNYTYFGTMDVGTHFPKMLAVAVGVTAVVTGIAVGVFCWLLLNIRPNGFLCRCAKCTHRAR